MKFALPLIVFLIIAGFLLRGLDLDPSELPSALIDKPAPDFRVPQLANTGVQFNTGDMRGQVWMLNIWASWCVACTVEHPVITDLANQALLPIVGLNYKDESPAALQWLERFGNPYASTAVDSDGRIGIDWGVYGVPETFIIDQKGNVRYKHIGPVDQNDLDTILIPLIQRLQAGQA